jgi:hypothetical protein
MSVVTDVTLADVFLQRVDHVRTTSRTERQTGQIASYALLLVLPDVAFV